MAAFLCYRKIAGFHGKADIFFTLGKPFQEFRTGFLFLFIGMNHRHACSLLDHIRLFSFKIRYGKNHTFYLCSGVLSIIIYFIREIGCTGGRTDIGNDIADFQIVAGISAFFSVITADIRHIIIIPELTHDVFIHLKIQCPVFYLKNIVSKFQ